MKAIPSLFTRFEFDENESLAASSFTELQRAFIHNERAMAAEEKAQLEFNAADLVGTARRDGFYLGMISAFTFLLEVDESARAKLRELQNKVKITPEPVPEKFQRDLRSIFEQPVPQPASSSKS